MDDLSRVTRVVRGLETMYFGDELKKLGILIQGKKRFRGDTMAVIIFEERERLNLSCMAEGVRTSSD